MKETPQPRVAGLSALPTRDDEGCWLAVIEATQGTRHKFKYSAQSNAFVLSGVLPLASPFLMTSASCLPPWARTAIRSTCCARQRALAPVHIVGVIEAEQRDKGARRIKRNDRLLAVTEPSHA